MQEDTWVSDAGSSQWFQREGRCLNRFVEPDLPTQGCTGKCKPANARLTAA